MEEASTMEEGYDDRGGFVLEQEVARQWEGGVLDQEMGVCMAHCSSDNLKEGIRGAMLGDDLIGSLEGPAVAGDLESDDSRHGGDAEKMETVLESNVYDAEVMMQNSDPVEAAGISVSRKPNLDWKKAVLGHGEEDNVKKVAPEKGRFDQEKNNSGDVWNGRSCRDLMFNEKTEQFLKEDGVTVTMDVVAAADCEVRLGKALVGKILGRPVPYGFLNRDLRRRWGKFGRIQLSLVGKNCFVCFFESEVIRDSVLRGGPWFVGNQLIGVDKWTVDFDPSSSLTGFS